MSLAKKSGHLLKKNGHLITCCCSHCCIDLDGKTLYMTADNFAIDLPLTGSGGAGDCNFFCTEEKLEAMGWTAVPSNPASGGFITWPNVIIPATSYFGFGIVSCFRLPSCSITCSKGTPEFDDGLYRYHFLSSGDSGPTGGTGISDTREMAYHSGGACDGGASGSTTNHCFFHSIKSLPASSDPADWPILGIGGSNCNPFYLEHVVEFRIYRWNNYGTPIDGSCYTTGRARIRVTE